MESRINNQALLLNEKLNDSQTENKTLHSHLLKAIQNLTSTVSHIVGRQTNNTPTAFKKEAQVNVKKLPPQSASSSVSVMFRVIVHLKSISKGKFLISKWDYTISKAVLHINTIHLSRKHP